VKGDGSREIRLGNAGALLLLLVGLAQMTGELLQTPRLKEVGALSVASPFPKVFTDFDGLEPFASAFTLDVEIGPGETEYIQITPEFYRRLKGPYNRRNAYGAALSYAPRLPQALWEAPFCHEFAKNGPTICFGTHGAFSALYGRFPAAVDGVLALVRLGLPVSPQQPDPEPVPCLHRRPALAHDLPAPGRTAEPGAPQPAMAISHHGLLDRLDSAGRPATASAAGPNCVLDHLGGI
jgi:hypothetical protein